MAFCATRAQFAAGWVTGGNRRRFEALTTTSAVPMGILARRAAEPVGWCACGPWSRYERSSRALIKIAGRQVDPERSAVWLVPCIFVRQGSRGQGVAHALVSAAVELAHSEGAHAVEGWPIARSVERSANAFLGREQLFEDLGFACIERPNPDRVIMRLELNVS
jgi:GNAT superfamily N-acetyltransferase